MPSFPPYIINKTAQKFQTGFCVVGVLFGLVAYGSFSNGEAGGGLACAAIAAASFFIASKIKTKKHYVGGSGIYK